MTRLSIARRVAACALTVLPLLAPPRCATAQEAGRPAQVQPPSGMRIFGKPASRADTDSIYAVLRRLSDGWERADADATVATYADDAEWTNAFGRVMRGRAELHAFLAELFADTVGTQGRTTSFAPLSMRYVGTDVAVFHSYQETTGQRSPRGTAMESRRIHSTLVLGKRAGQWRIVHQMIMDQRDTVP